MAIHSLQILLYGPGIRYVPDVVWHSKFFWIAIVVMTLAILFYHNYPSRKNGNPNERHLP